MPLCSPLFNKRQKATHERTTHEHKASHKVTNTKPSRLLANRHNATMHSCHHAATIKKGRKKHAEKKWNKADKFRVALPPAICHNPSQNPDWSHSPESQRPARGQRGACSRHSRDQEGGMNTWQMSMMADALVACLVTRYIEHIALAFYFIKKSSYVLWKQEFITFRHS